MGESGGKRAKFSGSVFREIHRVVVYRLQKFCKDILSRNSLVGSAKLLFNIIKLGGHTLFFCLSPHECRFTYVT